MPSIADNLANWNDPSNWRRDGDEWSESWGSTATMWFGSILPRIAANLPARDLLEIACGHGRVTAQLLPHCSDYVGIDLAPSCIAHCRERFAAVRHARFEVGDGSSLAAVGSAGIDFAFSWDSLVHAELDAISGYVAELARVLRPGVTAFLHHSNFAEFVRDGVATVANPHWRASSVSAALLATLAARAGLQVLAQELVQWGSATYSDCFTLLRRPVVDGAAPPPTRTFRHPAFNEELGLFRALDGLFRASLRDGT